MRGRAIIGVYKHKTAYKRQEGPWLLIEDVEAVGPFEPQNNLQQVQKPLLIQELGHKEACLSHSMNFFTPYSILL